MLPILSMVASTRSTYFSNPRALNHPFYKTNPTKEIPVAKTPKTGLEALLRPEDSILVLIDHQPYQFTNLNSHEPTMIVNNVIGLAKTAKVFNVPTILTTVKFSQRESCLRRLHFSGTKSYSPIPWRTRNTADASPALVTRCGRPGRTE